MRLAIPGNLSAPYPDETTSPARSDYKQVLGGVGDVNQRGASLAVRH